MFLNFTTFLQLGSLLSRHGRFTMFWRQQKCLSSSKLIISESLFCVPFLGGNCSSFLIISEFTLFVRRFSAFRIWNGGKNFSLRFSNYFLRFDNFEFWDGCEVRLSVTHLFRRRLIKMFIIKNVFLPTWASSRTIILLLTTIEK